MRRPILLVSLVPLIAAVGLVIYGSFRVPERSFTGELRQLLPPPPPGWTMKEKPIAESAEMQKAVGELLNFDDGVFVDYTSSVGERLSVYIAYWTPGRMSHRLIASHTPDVCWVGGGWKKTEERKIQGLAIGKMEDDDRQPEAANVALPVHAPQGEARTFAANGNSEYVWFWHLVGKESKSYGTGAQPPWHAAITDLLRKGLDQREEQFFIRLSSSQPLEPQMANPVLPAVLRRLPWPMPAN